MKYIFWAMFVFLSMSAAQTKIGNFIFVQRTDPITDQREQFLVTQYRPDSLINSANLYFACIGSEATVSLISRDYLTFSEWIKVIIRFGTATPREYFFRVTDGTTAFMNSFEIDNFIQNSLVNPQVVVRLIDESSKSYTYTFRLEGFRGVVSRLSCLQSRVSTLLSSPQSLTSSIKPEPKVASRPNFAVPNIGYLALRTFADYFEGSLRQLDVRRYELTSNGSSIIFTVGSTEINVDGRRVAISAPPIVYEGRIHIPSRIVSELGCSLLQTFSGTNIVEIDCQGVSQMLPHVVFR